MSDPTVIYAERLISAVARAFYEDDAICLIDILLRDKYLRDDDMGPRLSLRPKKLRKTLNFLQEEHIVNYEEVKLLTQSGKRSKQRTKFWYIDYNQAVHTIRLRMTLLKKQLEKEEHDARNTSLYICPGYNNNRCNGSYTEEEAQLAIDPISDLFLCPECKQAYESCIDINAPPKASYTLQLLDNSQAILKAEERKRRFDIQMNAKIIGYEQIRPSIYDLLKKVRSTGTMIPSNLPSDNLKGIGATIINLELEEGGSERAQSLAATGRGQKRKIIDAAACRIATSLPIEYELLSIQRQKKQKEENSERQASSREVKEFSFLTDNIGRSRRKRMIMTEEMEDGDEEVEEKNPNEQGIVPFMDRMEDSLHMSVSERMAAFQKQYKIEMAKQATLLSLEPDEEFKRIDETGHAVMWEDG